MSQKKVEILIVEDDLSFALELQMLAEELNYHVMGIAESSAEALDIIFGGSPDLILMDISIKGNLSGIEIGQKISHLDIPVIYITASQESKLYEDAKSSNIAGYLIKPIEKITLVSAIELALKNAYPSLQRTVKSMPFNPDPEFSGFSNILYVKHNETYFKVNMSDIIYFQSSDNYCVAHTISGEKIVIRQTLNNLESSLPSNCFMRVHRQFIVNLKFMISVNFTTNKLTIGKVDIPISRSRRSHLKGFIKKIQEVNQVINPKQQSNTED